MQRSRLHTGAALSHPLPFLTERCKAILQLSRCWIKTCKRRGKKTSRFFSKPDQQTLPLIRPAWHRLTEIQAGVRRQRDLSEDKPHPRWGGQLIAPSGLLKQARAPWKATRLICRDSRLWDFATWQQQLLRRGGMTETCSLFLEHTQVSRFNSDGKVVTGVYIKYVDVKPHRVLRSPEGYYIHTEEWNHLLLQWCCRIVPVILYQQVVTC